MTQLLINVVDISGGTHPDDKVRLWAPQHRADGARVVSTSPVDVPLVDGQATVDVLPGPARVQIMTQGVVDSAAKRVIIPDEPSITLRAVIEGSLEWEPEVISRVATLAQQVENVANAFGSLEDVAATVQAAEDAAVSAEADRLVVEQAAMSASWSGDQLTVLGATSPPLTGETGPAGETPYVGENGNWWVGDTDTGVRAQGEKGDAGDGTGDVLWLDLNPVLDSKADADHEHSWGDITSKPEAYPPEPHTHSEYVEVSRVTALEGSQPIIVSSLPSSPLPGRIYLVTG